MKNKQTSLLSQDCDGPNMPSRQPSSLDHVAREAAHLISLPDTERFAADQRVLQFTRVLETSLRFRREPPTDACTRAAWAHTAERADIRVAMNVPIVASSPPEQTGRDLATHETARNWHTPYRVLTRPTGYHDAALWRRRWAYASQTPQYSVGHGSYAAQR
jgi:hypothetical protein